MGQVKAQFIDIVQALSQTVGCEGGFTVRIRHDDGTIVHVGSGIAVARPEFSRSYGPEHDVFDAVNDYILTTDIEAEDRFGSLHAPADHLAYGAWRDSSTGTLWLDVVDIFPPARKDEAVQAGQVRNQIAVYDIGAQEEIPTGGTGEVQ